MRAAQYDWRQGPLEYTTYEYPRLKALIEETYKINNNSKVAITSLSMGGPYFLSFLNTHVNQEWKVVACAAFVSFFLLHLSPLIFFCFLYFFNLRCKIVQQDTYIHSFTSLDGAFGGSLSAVLSVGTKAGWLSQYFPVDNIQELIQSYPSVVWLLPLEQVSRSLSLSLSLYVCMVYIT